MAKRQSATATPPDDATIVQLDPSDILAEGNARYGLIQAEVDARAESILQAGEVLQPVDVEPIEGATAAPHYQLRSGFYRHAAVTKLNEEQKAGLKLPARVRPVFDALTRLKLQLMENVERKSLSPMDTAFAIRQLREHGVSTAEIGKVFQRIGGRKGNVMTALSPAAVRMHEQFLELPKAIQEKIHDGRVGVGAAYELTKVAPEKRQLVLDRAEADRIKALEQDEKEMKRFEEAEAALVAVQEKEAEAAAALVKAEEEAAAAAALVEQQKEAATEAYKATLAAKDAAAKKAAEEHFAAAEADAKGAAKSAFMAQKALEKIQNQAKAAAEKAAEKAAALVAARGKTKSTTAAKGKKAIGAGDVATAARAEGAARANTLKLRANDIRDAIKELLLPGTPAKVQQIGQALMDCFNGGSTPKQLMEALSTITGESVSKPGPHKVQKKTA